LIYNFFTCLTEAHLACSTFMIRLIKEALAGTCGATTVRADQHHIRGMQRGLALNNTTGAPRTSGLHMTLNKINPFDHHPVLGRKRLLDLTALVLIFAGDHQHLITFFNMHQSTSGASETIFMNCFSRNSRATGPKIRVPRGLFSLPMITAALSSKRICDPSGRTYSFAVRTITARTTSPFFTAPPVVASFTEATIT